MMCQPPVHAGGAHPRQHLVIRDLGPRHLLEPQHVSLAVHVLHDRPHRREPAVIADSPRSRST
jgi:hypothetical protein